MIYFMYICLRFVYQSVNALCLPGSLQALHSNNIKQITKIEHDRIRKHNRQDAAEDSNNGRPRTNPASVQGVDRT